MTPEQKLILDTIRSRRSTRAFTEEPLPEEVLTAIVETGLTAPSAMNRQAWHFTVLTNRAEIRALAAAVRTAMGRDEGYCFYDPTAFIVVSNQKDNPMGVDDCACAMENIFLAAHALGVGSVWINQLRHVCDESAVRDLLTAYGVPADHAVYGSVALGYPAKGPSPKTLSEGTVTYR